MLTPKEASLRGRIGAYTLHAKYDTKVISAPGRAAFAARFEKEVDPDGVLPEDERKRRAEMAKKAYYSRLGMLSSRKASKKKGAS